MFAGTDKIAVPDMRLVMQYLDKPNLRGNINAMARLIEEHGAHELQRVGVLIQEGGMRHLHTKHRDTLLTRCSVGLTRNCYDSRYLRHPSPRCHV
jgi:hypothetical protein